MIVFAWQNKFCLLGESRGSKRRKNLIYFKVWKIWLYYFGSELEVCFWVQKLELMKVNINWRNISIYNLALGLLPDFCWFQWLRVTEFVHSNSTHLQTNPQMLYITARMEKTVFFIYFTKLLWSLNNAYALL